MNVKEEIKKAIKHGIYLGNLSDAEQKKYLLELFSYLVEKNNFCFLTDNNQTVIVSSVDEEVAEIFVHAGTLKIIPQASDGYFQVFMDVLEFISAKHREEMKQLEKKTINEDDSTEDDGEMWL